MTKDEAIKELDEMPEGADEVIAHSRADAILLMCLRAAGYEDVADAWIRAYYRVGFWYS